MQEQPTRKLLEKLDAYAQRCLLEAVGAANSRGHYELTVEHLAAALLDAPESDWARAAAHFELDVPVVRRGIERTLENLRAGNTGKATWSPTLLALLREGWFAATLDLDLGTLRSGAVLYALVRQPERFLQDDLPGLAAITPERLRGEFRKATAGSAEDTAPAAGAAGAAVSGRPATGGALARFATNFTAAAREGKIDPVFGRDREIRQAVDILARRRKNNPIVVGEAGVGKTAIVEGLALRIVEGDVPDLLRNVEIYGLDLGLLQAGAGVKGEFENRLKGVIEEVKANPKGTILFIDEAHTLIGAGGAAGTADAANLLKPALARGEMRTIAATTWMEYKKYFEEDPALTRRFQPIKVDEPSPADAAIMLRGLKGKYEEAHGVTVREDAIGAAADLAARYIGGRQLPDKAVDLLDTAAARVKIAHTAKPGVVEDVERRIQSLGREIAALDRDRAGGAKVDEERAAAAKAELAAAEAEHARETERWTREAQAVRAVLDARKAAAEGGPKDAVESALAALRELQGRTPLIPLDVDPAVVAQIVADWTGVPVGKMVQDEARQVLLLEDQLKTRIKGQDHAMRIVAESLRSAKAGLRDPDKPMAVFLLAGPSGVGKTETALTVADMLFGGEKFLVSINMSEYQDREMGVSGLVGAKPGYVGYGKGGTLTEAVRQTPYSVVLLDEVEKACQEVRNLFYQVFDKGDLTDGTGRAIDFKNTVIFITSNLASQEIQDLVKAKAALLETPTHDEVLAAVRPILSKALQPAWLARCTVVPYYSLQGEALREIAKLKLGKVAKRLRTSHKLEVTFDDAVVDQIAERCTEVETGARNIDAILQGTLMPAISRELLTRMTEGELPPRLSIGLGEGGAYSLIFSA